MYIITQASWKYHYDDEKPEILGYHHDFEKLVDVFTEKAKILENDDNHDYKDIDLEVIPDKKEIHLSWNDLHEKWHYYAVVQPMPIEVPHFDGIKFLR